MNFYKLIKTGYVIRIEDNRAASVDGFYDPAEFWMKDGKLLAWCPSLGTINHHYTAKSLNEHFAQMLATGLDIIIKHKTDFVREYR